MLVPVNSTVTIQTRYVQQRGSVFQFVMRVPTGRSLNHIKAVVSEAIREAEFPLVGLSLEAMRKALERPRTNDALP